MSATDRPGRCPARERDGSQCAADSGKWTYARLCDRHHRLIACGLKIVLVDGMRLDRIWTAGRPYEGRFIQGPLLPRRPWRRREWWS